MLSRSFRYTVALTLTALVLAGCGQGDDNEEASGSGQSGHDRQAETGDKAGDEHARHQDGSGRDRQQPTGGHDEPRGRDRGHTKHDQARRRVHLTEAQRSRLDLRVAKAEEGSAASTVKAPATVRFSSDRVARVGPRLEAKVVEVTRDLGERVEAGETVAVLDSVALGRAKARYLTAAAEHEAARAEYRRDRKLAEQQIVSESELLKSKAEYQRARAQRDSARAELRLYGLDESAVEQLAFGGDQPLSRYYLTSPVDGVVQKRDLVPGQTVSASQTPIHVVDDRRMWVMVEAFEKDLPRLTPGQRVKLTVRALPGRTFTGKTDWVSRELDEQSRTVRVRAVVNNDDGVLRAGMFGRARIRTEAGKRRALVPVDAVQVIDGEDVVFVPGEEPGAFLAVTVRTGNESDGKVAIRSGLKPGERVVVAGAFDLKSALSASGRSAAHSH